MYRPQFQHAFAVMVEAFLSTQGIRESMAPHEIGKLFFERR
jgi:hypothetical protein